MKSSDWEQAANALLYCYETGKPMEPLTERYPDMTADDAYRVQMLQVERRKQQGERVVGQKVGLTSRPMRRALGVNEPDYGHIFDSMVYSDGAVVDHDRFLQPRVEPEVAFILDRALEGPGITPAAAARAIALCVPAIEIIDSRIVDWRITLSDTIADNGSSGGIVLGTRPLRPADLDLRLVGCLFSKNGEILETGAGAAVLGSPLASVAWLANTFGAAGVGLPEGSIIMSGSITAPMDAASGDRITAEFDRLGAVEVTFAGGLR
jgi:2-keto-4-pentenoate hydratase